MVIITITLPGESGQTTLRLELGPADKLTLADGIAVPLQDCTLAQLQQFADDLEAEAWAEYRDSTLVDLVVDDRLHIEVDYDATEGMVPAASDLLLDHAVIFPDIQDEPEDGDAAGSEQSSPDSAPGEAAEVEHDQASEDGVLSTAKSAGEITGTLAPRGEKEPGPVASEVVVDERETPEAASDPVDEAGDVDVEAEPMVTVAESEQIHEEREASAEVKTVEPEPPVVRPHRRILGRRRPLGHSTPSAVDILINETAFRDAQAHAISSPDREVAGVLIGPPPEKQPDGRYVVHISDMIIAKHTRMHGASVTYTPESWRYMNDRLAELYPDDSAVIVGWYHTHPGFGIFLSGMDQFIHHNFFTQLWHVALVLDPLARRSGFFSWDRSKSQVEAYEFPWPIWASESW
jgi:proteasome lid subunit RPN8/RPN11